MDQSSRKALALAALFAPLLHTITDLMEWLQGGFSPPQLWLNYLAFLPMPAIMLGLYAVQRPKVSRSALAGALVYGFAFIYFAFTTLLALHTDVATYAQLWSNLGVTYTAHGALMVLGGGLFGYATLRGGVLPRGGPVLFMAGLALNLGLTFLDVNDIYQVFGTALRNAGLIAMGFAIWKGRSGHELMPTRRDFRP